MLLKVPQVADRLSLSLSKVYELIEQGALGHHRLGFAIRVSDEQVEAYLEATKRERQGTTSRVPSRPRTRLRHLKL